MSGLSFNMADVTHAGIDELDAIPGFLEGFTFRRAGAQLGVTPFGMSIIDTAPETTLPEHGHYSEGPGNPPAHRLGQEEVTARFVSAYAITTRTAQLSQPLTLRS